MNTPLNIGFVTVLPEWVAQMQGYGIIGRAIRDGLVQIRCWNPRDYSKGPYRKIDDRPYGGGAGMVMTAGPLVRALEGAKQSLGAGVRVLCLSPRGKPVTQKDVLAFSRARALVLVAGRYQGIDQRAIEIAGMEEWCVGDFITSGGDLPALCLLDAIVRTLPNALGNEESTRYESFNDQLLEYPHYTRPEVYDGSRVPTVLLGGNHRAIARWRLQKSLECTYRRRPDLLSKRGMSAEERILLDEVLTKEVE